MKEKYIKFLKPIFQLASGSIIAQMITIIVSPITTRLFSTEELGMYTLILTIVSIFGPILCLRYDLSIVYSKNKSDEMNYIVLSTVFGIITSFLITFGYYFYLKSKINFVIYNKLLVLGLLLLILLLTSVINTLTAYNNKNKEYKLISSVYVYRTITQNVTLVLFGYLKFSYLGLLLSQVLSLLSGVKLQFSKLKDDLKELNNVTFITLKKHFIKEKKQLFFSTPASLLNTGAYSILNVFIANLFGLTVFGLYSMSFRILGLPLAIISTNVSRVYFEQISNKYNIDKNYRRQFINYSLVLLIIAIPMVFILVMYSPMIFEFVFGEGWGVSGMYVQILAPMYGLRLVVGTLTIGLTISGKQFYELILQSLFLGISIITFFITKFYLLNEFQFLKIISISYSIIYILLFIVMFSISKGEQND
ncbi:lipopolysaccharide biosynthesis protein [Vagococcus fluvialis]|uniref:lipopolysaccharide biosynthesis protein n=1 Tax=Vagococcus fluvialis TaxID=2738 RepID=UPI0037B88CF4